MKRARLVSTPALAILVSIVMADVSLAQQTPPERSVSLTLGYGRLTPGVAQVGFPVSLLDADWSLFSIAGGYWFSRHTQIEGALNVSSLRDAGAGSRFRIVPCPSSGPCEGNRRHYAWQVVPMVRIRQGVGRVFGNVGIGFLARGERQPAGVLIQGDGLARLSPAWSWGADVRVTERLLLGVKLIQANDVDQNGPRANTPYFATEGYCDIYGCYGPPTIDVAVTEQLQDSKAITFDVTILF